MLKNGKDNFKLIKGKINALSFRTLSSKKRQQKWNAEIMKEISNLREKVDGYSQTLKAKDDELKLIKESAKEFNNNEHIKVFHFIVYFLLYVGVLITLHKFDFQEIDIFRAILQVSHINL